MSARRKILYGLIFFILLVLAFVSGHLWKDLPGIEFDNKVKLFEILNLLLTLGIGVSIPLLVKKWIEDNRPVKMALCEEVKCIINKVDKIKQVICDCHASGSITKENKDNINYLFHNAEIQITSFGAQLKISFPTQSVGIMTQLKEKFNAYKDYLTGGQLMVSSFEKVDERFYRENNMEHSKIETELKTIAFQIHRL
jgi:hypothetical protein